VSEEVERGHARAGALQPHVRRPAAGPARGDVVGHWIGDQWARAAVGNYAARFVGCPEDHAELVEELRARQAVARGRRVTGLTAAERAGVGQALLGDRPAVGQPLALVRVEQAGSGHTLEDGGELPGQIVDVLHAGVEAEAAGGRHVVRRIASQEDAPLAVALGHEGRGHPRHRAEDLDVEVGDAGGLPHDGRASLGRVLLHRAVEREVVDEEAPPVHAVDGEEGRLQAGLLDEVERGRPAGSPRREVGAQEHVDAAIESGRALHRDAERLAHAAPRAVGRDQVSRAHGGLAAGVA
jgi:hypothetical protein